MKTKIPAPKLQAIDLLFDSIARAEESGPLVVPLCAISRNVRQLNAIFTIAKRKARPLGTGKVVLIVTLN
jgi:hypothetical protein